MGFADAFRPLQALAANRAEQQNAASLLRDSRAYAAKLAAQQRAQQQEDDAPKLAAFMGEKGYSPFRPGMMLGNDAAQVQGANAGADLAPGPLASLFRTAGSAMQAKAQADAPAMAAQQGGWIQTGLSSKEKRDEADRQEKARMAEAARVATAEQRRLDRAARADDQAANRDLRQSIADASRTRGQELKRIPPAVMKSMIENDVALSRIDEAFKNVGTNPQALGMSNMGPGAWIKNNVGGASPDEQATRASIADIGSQIIHDRSGAAVTVSEYPRLAPFVPSANDKPALAKTKLARLRALMQEEAALYRSNYGPDQGYMEFQGSSKPPNVNDDKGRKPTGVPMGDPGFQAFLKAKGITP